MVSKLQQIRYQKTLESLFIKSDFDYGMMISAPAIAVAVAATRTVQQVVATNLSSYYANKMLKNKIKPYLNIFNNADLQSIYKAFTCAKQTRFCGGVLSSTTSSLTLTLFPVKAVFAEALTFFINSPAGGNYSVMRTIPFLKQRALNACAFPKTLQKHSLRLPKTHLLSATKRPHRAV